MLIKERKSKGEIKKKGGDDEKECSIPDLLCKGIEFKHSLFCSAHLWFEIRVCILNQRKLLFFYYYSLFLSFVFNNGINEERKEEVGKRISSTKGNDKIIIGDELRGIICNIKDLHLPGILLNGPHLACHHTSAL